MSTTPKLRDAAQASPCPFCSGDSTAPSHSQHRPGCYFLVLASVKAAPQGDMSWAPELLAAWNRRASLTQGAGEAVEPVAWLSLDGVGDPNEALFTAQQLQQAVARALEPIQQAIRDYHYALDTRQHGGVAQGKAVGAIEEALGMPWKRGEELVARTPKDAGA